MKKRQPSSLWFSIVMVAVAVLVLCLYGCRADANLIIPCNGTIAECDADTAEFQMDSEIHHRLLQQQGKHIGYGALGPDRAGCNSGNGKAYASCVPQRNGNPPSRGCRPYERCRS